MFQIKKITVLIRIEFLNWSDSFQIKFTIFVI